MKTILVTGAAGYIGRHVVKNALDRGYRVIAADFNFKGVDERAEFCDVPLFGGDADLYRKLGSPDVCIHLAWRDGFRHNSAAHMKDLSALVTFFNTEGKKLTNVFFILAPLKHPSCKKVNNRNRKHVADNTDDVGL